MIKMRFWTTWVTKSVQFEHLQSRTTNKKYFFVLLIFLCFSSVQPKYTILSEFIPKFLAVWKKSLNSHYDRVLPLKFWFNKLLIPYHRSLQNASRTLHFSKILPGETPELRFLGGGYSRPSGVLYCGGIGLGGGSSPNAWLDL